MLFSTQFVLTFHRLTQDFVLICIPALIVSTQTSFLLLLAKFFVFFSLQYYKLDIILSSLPKAFSFRIRNYYDL